MSIINKIPLVIGADGLICQAQSSSHQLVDVNGNPLSSTTNTLSIQNKTFDTTNTFPITSLQPIYSGKWRTIPYAGALTGSAGQNGFIFYIPYYIGITHNVTDIAIEITTGVAASNINMALYADNNGIPGNKLEESGNIPSTSTGLKSYTFVSGTGGSGSYTLSSSNKIAWMALQVSSASCAVRFSNTAVSLLNTTAIGSNYGCYEQSQAFGSFPSTATPVPVTVNGWALLVHLKAQ